VDTQTVELFDLPDRLKINMPENTSIEVWEKALERSGGKDWEKETEQIRIAQNCKITAEKNEALYLASVFDKYVLLFKYDYRKKTCAEISQNFLPDDEKETESLYSLTRNGNKLVLRYKDDEVSVVSLIDLQNTPEIFMETERQNSTYAMVNEHLIFLLS
jgi:hypothetical protein